ncbi:MAG TPA: hypothetical protein EYQ43_10695 [Methyloprofundus sp.]|uniref:hypothetical protein n=1 Tax=Methyloprofundus sp. TaxID=2020875 RepID=UPI00185C9727|nr:hypothetical protein [Methyloprofundus sp.]HIG65992.1 hypothetical protein [Methyloprofundus sp.]HIL79505.1 hypothetical protein [Methylococcales bacterium]
MNEVIVPVQSLKTLIISMVCAILLAFFILIAFVAPAEYGIDPTGLGTELGLTELAPSTQVNTKAVLACPVGNQQSDWQDIVIITVPEKSGLEYKFYIQEDAEIAYEWSSDSSDLYYDFHGEPAGDQTGYFKSYRESTASQSNGLLTTPFTGIHGWYWRNDSNHAVQITLKTRGQYQVKGLI